MSFTKLSIALGAFVIENIQTIEEDMNVVEEDRVTWKN